MVRPSAELRRLKERERQRKAGLRRRGPESRFRIRRAPRTGTKCDSRAIRNCESNCEAFLLISNRTETRRGTAGQVMASPLNLSIRTVRNLDFRSARKVEARRDSAGEVGRSPATFELSPFSISVPLLKSFCLSLELCSL